jgi:hypothetical protein
MTQKTLLQRLLIITAIAVCSNFLPTWLEGRPHHGISNQQLAQNLSEFPKQFGDWESVSEEPLTPAVERILRCYGYVNRVYWNSKTGHRISLAILYGPRGPMAVHTPEICYSSRGRVPIGKPEEVVPGGSLKGHSFWRLDFKHPSSKSSDMEVWYAWSDGNDWIASDYPRFWITQSLFKIQLSGPPGAPDEVSACDDFLQHAVPVLKACLKL